MKSLVEALRRHSAILFVGAGVSMNIGLPSWKALIAPIAALADYDPDIFETLGDPLSLAEYYRLSTGSLEDLRRWMDEWHGDSQREQVGRSAIYRLIMGLPFSIIYTTNYDRYLEWACEIYGKKYAKISNVAELVHVPPD